MTERTPPPDERLPDQARARIRADLLAAAQDGSAGGRRWLVPAVAAASVVLVVGATAWAIGVGGDRQDGARPAGSPTSEVDPDAPTAAPDVIDVPSGGPSSPLTPDPTSSGGVSDPFSGTADPSTALVDDTCVPELENVLKGAEQVTAFPAEGGGGTSIWVKGDRFTVCDVRDGTITVHQPLPLEPDLDDVATFRVSSLFAPTESGFRAVRVAAGVVPDGALAYDVEYTFPDGHTEGADTTTDEQGRTWWRMVYAYDDDGGNETKLPPIEVAVSLSGSGFGFSLQWGVDTCAQANHGC